MYRLLIVDDTPSNRYLLRKVISDLGHECIEADNAFSAIDIIKGDSNIHCVISDTHMPGMSGIALVSEIRKDHPELPIISYSADLNMNAMASLINSGSNCFLDFPFNLKEIANQLNRLLPSSV